MIRIWEPTAVSQEDYRGSVICRKDDKYFVEVHLKNGELVFSPDFDTHDEAREFQKRLPDIKEAKQ